MLYRIATDDGYCTMNELSEAAFLEARNSLNPLRRVILHNLGHAFTGAPENRRIGYALSILFRFDFDDNVGEYLNAGGNICNGVFCPSVKNFYDWEKYAEEHGK